MSTYAGLIRTYDYRLVALSVFVAILATYVALDLADQLILLNDRRSSWRLSDGSVVLGMGILGHALHWHGSRPSPDPGAVRLAHSSGFHRRRYSCLSRLRTSSCQGAWTVES